MITMSDNDPIRSPSPNSAIHLKPKIDAHDGPIPGMNGNTLMSTPPTGRFSLPRQRSESNNPQRLVLKTRIENFPHSSSPVPPGSGHPTFHTASNGVGPRRQRPETSHQKAVNNNRKMRIDHILHNKIRYHHRMARENRFRARRSFGLMVMNRVKDLPDNYDTDDDTKWGPGGLVPNPGEMEDYGEEAMSYKKALDRAIRRMYREEDSGSLDGLVKGYHRRRRRSRDYVEDNERDGQSRKRRRDYDDILARPVGARGRSRREEALDDLDLALLGEGQDEDDEVDEEIDENDDGDMTEDEVMNEV